MQVKGEHPAPVLPPYYQRVSWSWCVNNAHGCFCTSAASPLSKQCTLFSSFESSNVITVFNFFCRFITQQHILNDLCCYIQDS